MAHESTEKAELATLIDTGLAEAKMTANQLAEKLGIDPAWITRVRQGKYLHPSLAALERVAKILNQDPVDYLAALQHDNHEEVAFERLIGHQLGFELGPDDEKFFREHAELYCERLKRHRRTHGCWNLPQT